MILMPHKKSKNNFNNSWGTVASAIVKYAALRKKLSCLEENLIAASELYLNILGVNASYQRGSTCKS